MSKREKIVEDIIAKIKTIRTVKLGRVSREPMFRDQTEFYNLARTAFPHIVVTTGNESREDITMGYSRKQMKREGVLNIEINVFVRANDKTIDEECNILIEALEEQLDKDRERSKNAHNFQIIQITMGEPMEHPYAQFTMTAEVIYTYTTGDT
tara:strand:- start:16 stop:474 length:459 start_codon:yes stop_codon:yes gene_type:complete